MLLTWILLWYFEFRFQLCECLNSVAFCCCSSWGAWLYISIKVKLPTISTGTIQPGRDLETFKWLTQTQTETFIFLILWMLLLIVFTEYVLHIWTSKNLTATEIEVAEEKCMYVSLGGRFTQATLWNTVVVSTAWQCWDLGFEFRLLFHA